MSAAAAPAILFVCTGNICRSPTAQALLANRAQAGGWAVEVDSGAVSDEERGNPFDRRAAAELRRRGVPMHAHRARQVRAADFARFDWIVGMTQAHCAALRRIAPPGTADRVLLLLDAAPGHAGQDVPDPWYGDEAAFVHAFDLIALGVDGLMTRLQRDA